MLARLRAPILALLVALPLTTRAATGRTQLVRTAPVQASGVARASTARSSPASLPFTRMFLRPQKPKATKPASRDPLSARLADHVAKFAGSWTFIGSFSLGMAAWMAYNSLSGHPFDAAPFIGLNLILSTVAALQAPFILMSSNRQADKDRVTAKADHELNAQAEREVAALHVKIDTLSEDVRKLTTALAAKQPAQP